MLLLSNQVYKVFKSIDLIFKTALHFQGVVIYCLSPLTIFLILAFFYQCGTLDLM